MKAPLLADPVTIGNATLYLGDCLEVLQTLRGADAVITDPPYEANAHTMQRRVLGRGIGRTRDLENQSLPFPPLTPEQRNGVATWSAANCTGWFLAFCQAEGVSSWRQALLDAGAKWRRTGIWVKPDSSPQLSGDRPAAGFEAIAMAWCGNGRSKWNGGGARGVWTFNKHEPGHGHGGPKNEHPTQKPSALMDQLVGLFSEPEALVIDPFMGSGTTGISCANLGRRFIGIEMDEEYFEVACRRIRAAYAQQRLFA